MAEHLSKLDAKIRVGVGAAFDFFAGRVQQAPRWIQRSGFEWLYRLTKDFKRLWPRYSRIVPLFLWKAAWQLAGRRPKPLDPAGTDGR
jgi:N-acetylglucosaminyldiphosphoundecaprenol N-acetyl-beta-D-mannosaminyltransferase